MMAREHRWAEFKSGSLVWTQGFMNREGGLLPQRQLPLPCPTGDRRHFFAPACKRVQKAKKRSMASSSILLRAEDGESGWTLIELQGTIESRTGAALDGTQFARLSREVCPCPALCQAPARNRGRPLRRTPGVFFERFVRSSRAAILLSQGGVPKLIMGKMQLEGTEVKLKKPLAIMTLIKPDEGSTEYHTAGVVRQKLVFRTRPVPASRPPLPEPSTLCGSKRTRSDEPVASPLPPPRK
jgi:hypothetical protein